jgi:hypothetical protein
MESTSPQEHPADPRADLALADEASRRLAEGLRLPTGFFVALAVTVTAQVGTAAYGISLQSTPGLAIALAGVTIFLGTAALLVRQFQRVNGVRVDGLASQVVLGGGATSSGAYLVALAAATWAAFEARWWLAAAAAVIGGVGYAIGALRWWKSYRHDPAAHAGGASPRMLGALAILAAIGFVALVVMG